MALHRIKKGLDLPITGAPSQSIEDGAAVTRVAVVAADFIGTKARMRVQVGDTVKRGQALFDDRKREGVVHTAPGAGEIVAVNRGDKRALVTVVIALNEREVAGTPGDDDFATFESYTGADPASLSADQIRELLIESGLWTALRARPFDRQPPVDEIPRAIFINAMDTRPLAGDVAASLKGREDDFNAGAAALAKLCERTFVCRAQGSGFGNGVAGVSVEEFSGPHPAGLPGTHIHTLSPVTRERVAWHVNHQDVAAIGALLRTGKIDVTRIVSLAGPAVEKPRLVKTRMGADIAALVSGGLKAGENRVISGSVLDGRAVDLEGPAAFLGRYDLQISALAEGREREFLGWLVPGMGKFSTLPTYLSALFPSASRRFAMTTSTHGSKRAMVPIGMYERVFPLDIIPTFLLRAICVDDVERAETLGVLELSEEDLALCTLVCPGKYDYGTILRRNLDLIEKEG